MLIHLRGMHASVSDSQASCRLYCSAQEPLVFLLIWQQRFLVPCYNFEDLRMLWPQGRSQGR